MWAKVVERSQKSVGSGNNRFGGPDHYVVVLEIPDGIVPPKCLNRRVLAKRGIKLHYMGEGYANRTGPKSSLGIARAAAQELAAQINNTKSP